MSHADVKQTTVVLCCALPRPKGHQRRRIRLAACLNYKQEAKLSLG